MNSIFFAVLFLLFLGGCANFGKPSGSPDYQNWVSCYRLAGAGDLKQLQNSWQVRCHNAKNRDQLTLLMVAAIQNRVNVMEWLVSQGQDINATSILNDTALNFAAVGNSVEALLWLLHHGANPHSVRPDGLNALMQVLNSGHEATALSLIEDKFPVNDANIYGWSPLFFAIHHKSLPVVQALVRHGAKIEITSTDGDTPLSLAMEGDWRDGAAYILAQIPNK